MAKFVGAEKGMTCGHFQTLVTNLLQKHWECHEERTVLLGAKDVPRQVRTALLPEVVARVLTESGKGRGADNTASSSTYERRENASYLHRYHGARATGHKWADTESVDEEVVVNSADLQGFVRSELEALSAGIGDFSIDLSRAFIHKESSKLENGAMELSAVPEALVTVRAPEIRRRPRVKARVSRQSHSLEMARKKWRRPSSANHLQNKLAAREAKSISHECGQRVVIGLAILDALERETRISRLGQMSLVGRP